MNGYTASLGSRPPSTSAQHTHRNRPPLWIVPVDSGVRLPPVSEILPPLRVALEVDPSEFEATLHRVLDAIANYGAELNTVRISAIRVPLAEVWPVENDEPVWPAPAETSLDDYRHIDGLPGVSERCWADVWTDGCALDDCTSADCEGSYVPCNEADTDDLGLCPEHRL